MFVEESYKTICCSPLMSVLEKLGSPYSKSCKDTRCLCWTDYLSSATVMAGFSLCSFLHYKGRSATTKSLSNHQQAITSSHHHFCTLVPDCCVITQRSILAK